MNRILAPILLLTLLFTTLAMGETIGDLVKRDGIYYKKFTDVPFNGEVTEAEDGALSYSIGKVMAGFYRHGKMVKPSQYLFEELREQIKHCWMPVVGMKNDRPIKITIKLTKNGVLEKPLTILNSNLYKNDIFFRVQAEFVIRALKNPKCVPFKLPLSLYDMWNEVTLSFMYDE